MKALMVLVLAVVLCGCRQSESIGIVLECEEAEETPQYPHLEEAQEEIDAKSKELETAQTQLSAETESISIRLDRWDSGWKLRLAKIRPKDEPLLFLETSLVIPIEEWEELRDKIDGLLQPEIPMFIFGVEAGFNICDNCGNPVR